jgi:hypothetical protein
MGETKIIVDHEKLEYTGLLDVKGLFNCIDNWLIEHTQEKKTDKLIEQDEPNGKFIEWLTSSWTKMTDYMRFIIKIRVLMYDVNKVDVMKGKKKLKLSHARILMVFDCFLEFDYENRWTEKPLHVFFATLYNKFIYKSYTERFEQRITHLTHRLYHHVEQYLNMYRHYRPISKIPHFYH